MSVVKTIDARIASPSESVAQRSSNNPHRVSTTSSLIPRGRALFWEGDEQTNKIEIVEGVVRAVRLLENGNRQILAFYWPGDTVMPCRSSTQHFTAEAVTNCRVRLSLASQACSRGEPCGALHVLGEMLSLITSMSQKTSVPRIAWFLLRARERLPEDPKLPHAQQLLVSRADIADYVGTSLETVCRTLADLKLRKLIDLPSRKTIRYINLPALERLADE